MSKLKIFNTDYITKMLDIVNKSNCDYYIGGTGYYGTKDRQFNKELSEVDLSKAMMIQNINPDEDGVCRDSIVIGDFIIVFVRLKFANLIDEIVDIYAEHVDKTRSNMHQRFAIRDDVFTNIINYCVMNRFKMNIETHELKCLHHQEVKLK